MATSKAQTGLLSLSSLPEASGKPATPLVNSPTTLSEPTASRSPSTKAFAPRPPNHVHQGVATGCSTRSAWRRRPMASGRLRLHAAVQASGARSGRTPTRALHSSATICSGVWRLRFMGLLLANPGRWESPIGSGSAFGATPLSQTGGNLTVQPPASCTFLSGCQLQGLCLQQALQAASRGLLARDELARAGCQRHDRQCWADHAVRDVATRVRDKEVGYVPGLVHLVETDVAGSLPIRAPPHS